MRERDVMKALVLHGFTGSLDTVTPLGKRLEKEGVEVALPIMRGHGTRPEDLFRVHWRDWVADAREAFLKLAPRESDQVLVAGLSMGALVSCILAAEFPNRVKKLALLAPAFAFRSRLVHLVPVLKTVYSKWSSTPEFADPDLLSQNTNYLHFPIETFQQVLALTQVSQDLLPHVTCPVATFLSKKDPAIPIKVLRMLDRKLGSGPAKRHVYKVSYHELLQDVEAERVIGDVMNFFFSRSSTGRH